MHADIVEALPELVLDGVLVEQMREKGAEAHCGSGKDPQWGPVLLVGSGGVFADALHDIRLLPPDLSVEAIID